jgi:hypothetical protein
MAEGMYGAGGKEVQRVIDGCARLAKAVLVAHSERGRLAAGKPQKPEVVLIQCPVGVDHDLVWFLKHAGMILEGCKLQLESTKRAFDKLEKQVLSEAESFDTSDDEDNGEADVEDGGEDEDEEMEEDEDEEEEHEM